MRGILFSALLLAGCATTQPAIRTQIVEKTVIQVQKCVKAEDVPVRPRPLSEAKPNDLEAALSIALTKISEWTRYGNKADEVLTNCR